MNGYTVLLGEGQVGHNRFDILESNGPDIFIGGEEASDLVPKTGHWLALALT